MNKKLIFAVLVVLVALMPLGAVQGKGEQPPTPASEEPWTNSTTEFRPDIGLMDPDLEPGVNGYKIFNPGAISIFSMQRQGNEPDGILVDTRIANTDAFRYGCDITPYYCGGGDHNSENDGYFEDEIWVDGCIKRKGNYAWADCDDDHTSGYIAHVDTSMWGGLAWQFTAKSWHHFHSDGFYDWNPITQDTY